MRRSLETKALRGERLGTTPLGYTTEQTPDGAVVTVDPEGQETVRIARQLRQAGVSFRKIAAPLTAEGRPTQRGGQWQPETVRKLIAPRYLERINSDAAMVA